MKQFTVRQRVIQTIVYHVEAETEAEAISIVNAGQACVAYEIDGDIISTSCEP